MPGHWNVIDGDCVEQMALMDEASVDAVVTDPPYGLSAEPDAAEVLRHWLAGDDYQHRGGGFMGRTWDSFVPGPTYWREAFRVLKPGGWLLAFSGTRTEDLLGLAIRLAGFERRDTIVWLYGSGFPKSLAVANAISPSDEDGNTDPARDALAGPWQGWGTALKPAHEPIVVARKPLAGTVAGNVLAHRTGALNIDGCRIGTDPITVKGYRADNGAWSANGADDTSAERGMFAAGIERDPTTHAGRWPANVVLDPEAAAILDEQAPNTGGGGFCGGGIGDGLVYGAPGSGQTRVTGRVDANGGASRFFYCAKSSSAERNAGLDEFEAVERTGQSAWAGCCNVCGCRMMLYGKPTCGHDDFRWVEGKPTKNSHPTVKPIALMRWLIRLVTPPGGTVLDPFAGSGTTGCAAMLEGFRFVGIEREPEYTAIARARIAWWAEHPEGMELVARLEHEAERKRVAESGQLGLFG